jgi:hypothetical protein
LDLSFKSLRKSSIDQPVYTLFEPIQDTHENPFDVCVNRNRLTHNVRVFTDTEGLATL